MAIQKTKVLQNGASGNYWRIMNINVNRVTLTASCQIGLFKDAATAAANKPDLGLVKTFHFPFTVGEISQITNIVAYIYAKVMTAAEVQVNKDLFGNVLDAPRAYDPDIAGGSFV